MVPINSFIDEYCLIFAPDALIDTLQEKKKIFTEYKSLIKSTISNFQKSCGLPETILEEVITHCAHRITD